MLSWFQQLLENSSNHMLLQMLWAALATLVLEDPTAIACGLLVADDQMHFLTAYLGITLGIAFGDFALYGLGRAMGPKTAQWRLVPADRLDRVRGWFNRNIIITVLIARFIPGMRLPTYVGAGIFRASPIRFLGTALITSLTWNFLLLMLTVHLGRAVLPLLGRYKWWVAGFALAIFIAAQFLLTRWQARKLAAERGGGERTYKSPVSLFEFWPAWLFYLPIIPYYAWLSLRFHSPALPTIVNPNIFAGGLLGDPKSDLLSHIPENFRNRVAPWVRVELPDPPIPLREQIATIHLTRARAGLAYPIVAKPDIGHRGAGVQPLRNDEQLRQYLEAFPSGHPLMLQSLIELPGEAAVVYCRRPDEAKGRIVSLTLKHFPFVTGDGKRSLRELIMADERAAIIHDIYFRRFARQVDRVLANGEVLPLVFTGNHRQGAVLKNANDMITPELTATIDEIARSIPEFYYGRFQLKFAALYNFLHGDDFVILELNGAGAEVLHIWDANTTPLQAYRALFQQWRTLFEIGAVNRRRGFMPLPWGSLWREAKAHFRPRIHYPPAQ